MCVNTGAVSLMDECVVGNLIGKVTDGSPVDKPKDTRDVAFTLPIR